MTIASTTNKVSYNGSGSAGPFSITFKFSKNADIVATKVSTAGVESTLALTTHYTLTGAGDASGGTLTLVTALATGEMLIVKRSPAIVQETDYVENADFPAESHEAALDLLTMVCQDLDEKIGRAVLVDISSSTSPEDLLDELAADVAAAEVSATAAALAETNAETAETNAEAAQAAAEAAAATVPTFPALTGQAGNIPRVKVGEAEMEFRTPAQVLSDIGGEPADADILKADTTDTLVVGFTETAVAYTSSNAVSVSAGSLRTLDTTGGVTIGPISGVGRVTLLLTGGGAVAYDAGYDYVIGTYNAAKAGCAVQAINDGTSQWLIFANTEA